MRSFSVKTNDYMQVIYVSSLLKSVISLHNLINNKIHGKEIEADNLRKEREKEEETRKKAEEILKKRAAEKLEEESKAAGGAPDAPSKY